MNRVIIGSLVLVAALCCFVPFNAALASGLDPGFADKGVAITSLGPYDDRASDVAVQPDGKIVVAGSSANSANLDLALARYNPDGSLDPGFSEDGLVVVDVSGDDDEAVAVAVMPDGAIVAAGYTFNGADRDFVLARFLENGALDHGFGVNGIVVMAVGNSDDVITAVAGQEDGSVLVAGYATGTNGRVVVLGRFLANGSPDPSFEGAGLTLTGVGVDATASAMAVQENGKILVTGSYRENTLAGVLLLRFNSDGGIDETFGVDGMAEPFSDGRPTEGKGLWIEEDGHILVTGSTGVGADRDVALLRFSREGLLDAEFGHFGTVITDVYGDDDVGFDVIVDSSGAIVVAGYATRAGLRDFLLLRYDRESLISSGRRMADLEEDAVRMVNPSLSPDDDDAGYALALDVEDRVLAAGFSKESGVSRFALARFGETTETAAPAEAEVKTTSKESDEEQPGSRSSYITTTPLTNITRTGAFTGGIISDESELSFSQRGVVFSIAPYPVFKKGGTSPTDPTNPTDPTDTTPPTRSGGSPSGTLDAGTTSATIKLSTDEKAECRQSITAGTAFTSMSAFSTTNATSHSQGITGLQDGKTYNYYVRCKDEKGNANTNDYAITFSVATATRADLPLTSGIRPVKVDDLDSTSTSTSTSTSGESTNTTETTNSSDNEPVGSSNVTVVREGYTEDGFGPGQYSSILIDLTPGTRYFVRAYAVTSDNKVYYGNELIFETADACFVATAAFGSLLEPQVAVLREVRDRLLLDSPAGAALVRAYYRLSPPLAEFIANHDTAKRLTRAALLPVVGIGSFLLHFGLAGLMAVLVCLVTSGAWIAGRAGRSGR